MIRVFAAAVCSLVLSGICHAAPGETPALPPGPPRAAGDSLKADAEQASRAAEIAREEAARRETAQRRAADIFDPGPGAAQEPSDAEEGGEEEGGILVGRASAESPDETEAGEPEAGDDVNSAAKERAEIERVEREAAEGTTIIDKDAPRVAKEVEEVEEGQKKLPIVADADSVEFDREQNVITGSGNAVVRYKDAKLTANKITVYMETGDAYAEGDVSLFQDGQFLTGKTIHYNFQSGQGSIDECHAYVQPWYGYGKVVRRISEDEYQVENGYVTTCDYTKPHTSIRAKQIFIYPGDSVVAHNPVFYLYDTPAFWAPYAKFSLTDDESPYNLVPGYSSDWGVFVLSAIDVYKTKNIRVTPMIDFRSKNGLGVGTTLAYDLPSARARGETVFYYAHDNDPDWVLNSDDSIKDRYRVTLEHQQDLSEDTALTVKFNKQSDEDIVDNFFREEYEDDIQRENYLDITKAEEKFQISLRAEPRFDKFYTVVQRLPEFSVDAVDQRISDTPLFYNSHSSITNFDYRFSDDPLTADQVDQGIPEPEIPDPIKSLRVDTYHEISYPKKYFKFLNFKPWAGFRETFYSKAPSEASTFQGTGVLYDTDGDGVLDQELASEIRGPEDKNVWRGLFTLGAETGTKFWKVWDYYNNTFKINKLRHVFEPTLTYQYFSKPTRTYADEVYAFDQYDFFNETSMFTLMLRNALQTKRGEGEDVNLFDIKFYFDMMTSRNKFNGYEHRAFADDHYSSAEVTDGFDKLLNDVFIDAEFRPLDWQRLDFEGYLRPDDPARLDEWNTDYYVYCDDVVSLALGQRYLVDDSNLWTTEFNVQLNDDWAARTYLRFETADGTFEEGEWSLFRDLHEWEMAFTVRYKGRRKDSYGFFVLFYLDAYPDVPLETRF